jgi:hypothetical protein
MAKPLATHDFADGGLNAAILFFRRTREELRMLRMVRVSTQWVRLFDINGDYFELRGLGYSDDWRANLKRVATHEAVPLERVRPCKAFRRRADQLHTSVIGTAHKRSSSQIGRCTRVLSATVTRVKFIVCVKWRHCTAIAPARVAAASTDRGEPPDTLPTRRGGISFENLLTTGKRGLKVTSIELADRDGSRLYGQFSNVSR